MQTAINTKQYAMRQLRAVRASRTTLIVKSVALDPLPGMRSNPLDDTPGRLIKQRQHGRGVPATKVFCDKDGQKIKPMPADYGFRSGSGRLYEEHYGEVPKSVWELVAKHHQPSMADSRMHQVMPVGCACRLCTQAGQSFHQELDHMRSSYRHYQEYSAGPSSGIMDKVNAALGSGVAKVAGAIDERLEAVGLLPKLEPPPQLTPGQIAEFDKIQMKLESLKLDSSAVAREEHARIERSGDMAETPALVKAPFLALCWVLDVMYEGRPIPKFWALETVARIPYFAYMAVLHLYESLGLYRAGAELRKVHFAEEWNELHHLQIMESLGGDQAWIDRFLAEHAAFFYYWLLVGFYFASPRLAYNFMQRVEHHASDTYSVFLEANKDILATIPPPAVAVQYYRGDDLYLFDEFQAAHEATARRRPDCNNLLDVFTNIRDDENEHVKTMAACQSDEIAKTLSAKGK